MKPTLVEAQSSSDYGKVPYTTSGPPKLTNTGDIHKNGYKNIIIEINNASRKTVPKNVFPIFQQSDFVFKLSLSISKASSPVRFRIYLPVLQDS